MQLRLKGKYEEAEKVLLEVENYNSITKHFEKQQNPEWNQVFAFSKDRMQSSILEVVIKDKDLVKDGFVGIMRFGISEVPSRVPPVNPLAPEWYLLEDKEREKIHEECVTDDLKLTFGNSKTR